MWNFLAVVLITLALGGVLFVYKPRAHKVLSATRWMLLVWGFLIVVHLASPIRYQSMGISWSTWLYCGVWLAAFALGDNVQFTFWPKSDTGETPLRSISCSANTMRVLSALSCAGAALLIYTRLNTLATLEPTSVLQDIRETQLEGTDIGIVKTAAMFLAACGLVAALIDACGAVCAQTSIPLRAGVSLIAYLAIPVSVGGRPGFVMGTGSLLIAVFASIYISGRGFSRYRSLLLVGAVLIVTSSVYFTLVVSSRSTTFLGNMDSRYAAMNRLWNSELQPDFRDSLQPLGSFGDAILDSFYYFSPQVYGLDHVLHNYRGPYTLGGTEFDVIVRHLEKPFGIDLVAAEDREDAQIFQAIGVFPHFFRTAVYTTFIDFGLVLGIPFVYLCGTLCRRARMRALRSQAPFWIAIQSLICCGMTLTVISGPFCDESFTFPLMWFIAIYIVLEMTHSTVSLPLQKCANLR